MRIAFDGLVAPIRFHGCDDVLRVLDVVMPDWPRAESQAHAADPQICMEATGGGYRLQAPWHCKPILEPTAVSAACSLIVDLVRAYAFDNPDLFCLHAASACVGGRLVVFPSDYRAGKSMFMAGLASTGTTVFADDVMALANDDSSSGRAFGISPRLRLPLPGSASHAFAEFVARHRGPADRWYCYLQLPHGRLAGYGASAPVAAFVFLDRQSAGPAEVRPVSKAESLRRLILRNFGRIAPAAVVLDRMRLIVEAVPCLRLRYSRLEEAVDLMMHTIVSDARVPAWSGGPALPTGSADRHADPAPRQRTPPGRGEYVQADHVELRRLDEEAFLADSRGNAIFGLDAVGALIWGLIREPVTLGTLVDQLEAAFGNVQRDRLRSDAENLLDQFLKEGLIERGDS